MMPDAFIFNPHMRSYLTLSSSSALTALTRCSHPPFNFFSSLSYNITSFPLPPQLTTEEHQRTTGA